MNGRAIGTVLTLALLAGCSGPGNGGGPGYTRQDAMDDASFRLNAREVVGLLNPVCPYTKDAEQLARYDAPRARFAKLRDWVAATPFTIDLAIVESDYAAYWQGRETNCGATDTKEARERLDTDLGAVDGHLAALEKLAGMP